MTGLTARHLATSFLSLFVLCLVSAGPVPRQLPTAIRAATGDAADFNGHYKRFFEFVNKQNACPRDIVHKDAVLVGDTAMIPHHSMMEDGAMCSGEGAVVLKKYGHSEESRIKASWNHTLQLSKIASIFNKVLGSLKVYFEGSEEKGRVCGGYKHVPGVSVLFTKESSAFSKTFSIDAPTGTKFMLIGGPDMLCAYIAPIDNKVNNIEVGDQTIVIEKVKGITVAPTQLHDGGTTAPMHTENVMHTTKISPTDKEKPFRGSNVPETGTDNPEHKIGDSNGRGSLVPETGGVSPAHKGGGSPGGGSTVPETGEVNPGLKRDSSTAGDSTVPETAGVETRHKGDRSTSGDSTAPETGGVNPGHKGGGNTGGDSTVPGTGGPDAGAKGGGSTGGGSTEPETGGVNPGHKGGDSVGGGRAMPETGNVDSGAKEGGSTGGGRTVPETGGVNPRHKGDGSTAEDNTVPDTGVVDSGHKGDGSTAGDSTVPEIGGVNHGHEGGGSTGGKSTVPETGGVNPGHKGDGSTGGDSAVPGPGDVDPAAKGDGITGGGSTGNSDESDGPVVAGSDSSGQERTATAAESSTDDSSESRGSAVTVSGGSGQQGDGADVGSSTGISGQTSGSARSGSDGSGQARDGSSSRTSTGKSGDSMVISSTANSVGSANSGGKDGEFVANIDPMAEINGTEPSSSPSPTETPSPSPNATPLPLSIFPTTAYNVTAGSPTPVPDSSSTCFPAKALVTLADGTMKAMSSLTIGDRVAVGGGETSEVYAFSHADADATPIFVELSTKEGVLTATATHYVYVRGRGLVAAGTVRVDDALVRSDGSAAIVDAVRAVQSRGLYNPQTFHGDVVVNGFRTSTYTTAVPPRIAEALLAPVRTLYSVGVPDRLLTLTYGGGWIADWALASTHSRK